MCDFERILKTECNLQHFTRNYRIMNLDDFERDEADAYLWREGILNMKEKEMNQVIRLYYISDNISDYISDYNKTIYQIRIFI